MPCIAAVNLIPPNTIYSFLFHPSVLANRLGSYAKGGKILFTTSRAGPRLQPASPV